MSRHHPILLGLIVFLMLILILFFYLHGFTSAQREIPIRITLNERTFQNGETLRGFILHEAGTPARAAITIYAKKTNSAITRSFLPLSVGQSTGFSVRIPKATSSGSYLLRVEARGQQGQSLFLVTRPAALPLQEKPAGSTTAPRSTIPEETPDSTTFVPEPPHADSSQSPPESQHEQINPSDSFTDILARASQSPTPREICSELGERTSYETCLAFSASNDAAICQAITDESLHDQCLAQVVVATREMRWCDEITSAPLRAQCRSIQ